MLVWAGFLWAIAGSFLERYGSCETEPLEEATVEAATSKMRCGHQVGWQVSAHIVVLVERGEYRSLVQPDLSPEAEQLPLDLVRYPGLLYIRSAPVIGHYIPTSFGPLMLRVVHVWHVDSTWTCRVPVVIFGILG